MRVRLLYSDHEWVGIDKYRDTNNIIQDLGLKTLFTMASKDVLKEDGAVKKVLDADDFIRDVVSKVMMVPLENEEEIYYRQGIVQDCLNNEDFIEGLYRIATDMSIQWDKLGRKDNENKARSNDVSWLMSRIRIIRLFVNGLSKLKHFFASYQGTFSSEGIAGFVKHLLEDFSLEDEKKYIELLESVDFYVSEGLMADDERIVCKPRIVLECGIAGGLKLTDVQLSEIETLHQKYRNPNSTLNKLREYVDNHTATDSIILSGDMMLEKQVAELVYRIMRYIVTYLEPFYEDCAVFFDQLRIQTAFYRGAVNLKHHAERFQLHICMPKVCGQEQLHYDTLKEFVMCIEQRITAIGNTCDIDDKLLVVITGANQGGKSTFLRSLGIAQVMMQCGFFVVAKKFEAGIFPQIFTHFTRREDSAMNSGRLDEELSRMSQIIDSITPGSLVLLNESFATTTEKEGSNIAYDIIRALHEAGIKIITVTHLLSFAQRLYSETASGETSADASESGSANENKAWNNGVAFFCAERLPDGRRTYKMVQSVPELTSFGLDLYNEIIGG